MPLREAEDHQVLDGFLPEIVIDAEHLVLGEVPVHELVQLAGAFEVGAERLLDNHAAPAFGEARAASPEAPSCSMTVAYAAGGIAR